MKSLRISAQEKRVWEQDGDVCGYCEELDGTLH